MNVFETFAQSNDGFNQYEKLDVAVDKCFLPQGGVRTKLDELTMNQGAVRLAKTSLIHSDIYLNRRRFPGDRLDVRCLPISIIIGIEYLRHSKGSMGTRVILQLLSDRKRYQCTVNSKVEHLNALAGVDLANFEELPGEREFMAYQKVLIDYLSRMDQLDRANGLPFKATTYKLVIYDRKHNVIFTGSLPQECTEFTTLNLLLDREHFDYIKSLTGVFATAYFCEFCHNGYSTKSRHKNCIYTCEFCLTGPPCKLKFQNYPDYKDCTDCGRCFYNEACFKQHIDQKICDNVKVCSDCLRFKHGKVHDCAKFYCVICRENQEYGHTCYIPAYQPRKPGKIKDVFIFYDLECMAISTGNVKIGEVHVPNLCIASAVCDACIDVDAVDNVCEVCGVRKNVFTYNNEDENAVIDNFLDYLFTLKKKFSLTIIAHNGGRYDIHFLIRRIFETQPLVRPTLVMRGTKVFLLKIGRLRFIDSFNFSCCALSKLPTMFGLETASKGYFPHTFNTRSNQSYVGGYPDRSFYEPENMACSEVNKFDAWYRSVQHDRFDFQEQLLKYCNQDVEILRKFCVKLALQIFADCGIKIFLESVTLASFVSKVFRKDFYDGRLAVIPKNGYRLADKQSLIAIKYFKYLEKSLNIKLETAYNGRERVLVCGSARLKVDGYYEKEIVNDSGQTVIEKHVIEFQGCRWHGHSCINNSLSNNPKVIGHQILASLRREETVRKVALLRTYGYIVLEMWECKFREFLNTSPATVAYLKTVNTDKLEPRDAFFGGNTDCTAVYYKCKPGEQINYYDVCSLYPTVNKYDKLPINIPKLYIDDDCKNVDLNTFNGLVKAFVLPPKRLFHPVLPVKINGKLMYPLCYACAKSYNNEVCRHKDEKRGWVGTFVADEFRIAVELGYRVGKVYEIWEYETVDGYFAAFVKHFEIEKLYASGFPKTFDESNIHEFIDAYYAREHILLDKTRFIFNAAKRNFAKRILNSLWGKLAERPPPSVAIVTSPAQFTKLITNSHVTIHGIKMINDKVLLVNYADLDAREQNTVNVVAALYTTSNARIRLQRMLQICGRGSLYNDTDCVFFIQKRGEPPLLTTGPNLGDLTNELIEYGENAYIDEFCSNGPKSYSYRVTNTASGVDVEVTKVKGIFINSKNSKIINFEALRNQILNPNPPDVAVTDTAFVRDKDSTVRTLKRTKKFRAVIDKRRIIGNRTYPYGYMLTPSEEALEVEEADFMRAAMHF